MANTLTAFTPTIWSRESIAILREKIVMPGLVNLDFAKDVSQGGDTINTRKVAKFTASDVHTVNGVTVSDASATNVAISLNKHRNVTFRITDREQTYSFDNLAARFIDPAMLAIAVDVDTALLALYTDITTNTVTVSSAGGWKTAINSARTKLNKRKVETESRYAVLSDDDEGAMSNIDLYQQVNTSGSDVTLRNGILGRLKNFDIARGSNVYSVGSPAVRKNLLFQKNAFALVVRPLGTAAGIAPGVMQDVAMDPDGGIALRVTISYNAGLLATQVTCDILYGVKTLDEERACLVNASGF